MSSNPVLQQRHLAPHRPGHVPTGPIETDDCFSIDRVVTKAGLLISIVIVAGFFGWATVEPPTELEPAAIPGWILFGVLGGLGLVVLSYYRPELAKYLAPAYAVVEGLVVGAISHVYEIRFDGIVLQAVVGTVGVFAAMLGLHASRLFRMTPKIRRGVFMATAGVMSIYLFQVVMRLFGTDLEVPFLHDSGPVGILISVAIVGLAAFNLLVDFDLIEKAEQHGAERTMEWTAALGLVVTLIWLYLEILRLLGKVRS